LAGSRPTSINPRTTESGSTRTTPQSPQPGTRTGELDQQKIPGAPLRVSFAKIQEPLEVPDLLALQTASFDWLIGSPEWRATLAAEEQAGAVGGLAGPGTGLRRLRGGAGGAGLGGAGVDAGGARACQDASFQGPHDVRAGLCGVVVGSGGLSATVWGAGQVVDRVAGTAPGHPW
jgi:hypothetical protein